jgi:hypothetical protein
MAAAEKTEVILVDSSDSGDEVILVDSSDSGDGSDSGDSSDSSDFVNSASNESDDASVQSRSDDNDPAEHSTGDSSDFVNSASNESDDASVQSRSDDNKTADHPTGLSGTDERLDDGIPGPAEAAETPTGSSSADTDISKPAGHTHKLDEDDEQIVRNHISPVPTHIFFTEAFTSEEFVDSGFQIVHTNGTDRKYVNVNIAETKEIVAVIEIGPYDEHYNICMIVSSAGNDIARYMYTILHFYANNVYIDTDITKLTYKKDVKTNCRLGRLFRDTSTASSASSAAAPWQPSAASSAS